MYLYGNCIALGKIDLCVNNVSGIEAVLVLVGSFCFNDGRDLYVEFCCQSVWSQYVGVEYDLTLFFGTVY